MKNHIDRIAAHYDHAREKHPYFCDRITCLSDTGADTHLDIYRSTLSAEREASDVEACTVLVCEVYEAMQAYTHGDTAHAVEECYDAIAVLLRTIDVLEGRLSELGHFVINPVNIACTFGTLKEIAKSFAYYYYDVMKAFQNKSAFRADKMRLAQFIMDADLAAVRSCDAIYLLRGWETSRGAKKELSEAIAHGLKVIQEGGLI